MAVFTRSNSRNVIGIMLVILVAALLLLLFFFGLPKMQKQQGETISDDQGRPSGMVDGDNGGVSDQSIRVFSPSPNEVVSSPFVVRGEAKNWYFEAEFSMTLYAASGERLAVSIATAEGDWMTDNFVPFSGGFVFDSKGETEGKIVFEKANPSGLPQYGGSYEIPVRFNPPSEDLTTIRVYFGNLSRNPDMVDCQAVFPVRRSITSTPAIGRSALEELFRGVTDDEEQQGFFSSINPGVRVLGLDISNGIAKVDLSSEIEKEVGGSCRVSAIRAQITETLKQFPTVDDVVISVEGRTDEALQP